MTQINVSGALPFQNWTFIYWYGTFGGVVWYIPFSGPNPNYLNDGKSKTVRAQ